jgi:hypothetical protein
VAAKNIVGSVPTYIELETGFTLLQFAVVGPLVALAHRNRAHRDAGMESKARAVMPNYIIAYHGAGKFETPEQGAAARAKWKAWLAALTRPWSIRIPRSCAASR